MRTDLPISEMDLSWSQLGARAFDQTSLRLFYAMARGLGYRFAVGTDEDLARDAQGVHRAVWSAIGISVPENAKSFGVRYDRALKASVVAYRGGVPVGALGLFDMRIASITLDYEGRSAPGDLDLSKTLEIGRLAVLPKFRGKGQFILFGLVTRMMSWCRQNSVEQVFTGSKPKLYHVYRRFNPHVRLVTAPRLEVEDPLQTRYFENLRSYGGEGCMYVFDIDAVSPASVLGGLVKRTFRAN
jgi:GNAT superfamily N-acetyltransferase